MGQEAELRAAVAAQGLACERLVCLRSTNNTVTLVLPAGVVVKGHRDHPAAQRELQIARVLSAAGAPVVPPAAGLEHLVGEAAGQPLTFWSYVEPIPGELDAAELAHGLAALHWALHGCQAEAGPLRDCSAMLNDARAVLQSGILDPVLTREDRRLLADVLHDVSRQLADVRHQSVLHGSPHRGNVIAGRAGIVFIDFETICVGPVEWDLAHLDVHVAEFFPTAVDEGLLRACRLGVSATTAVWCWADVDRGDLRAHAEHHLEVVKTAAW
jgi:hypothetical protein